MTRAVLLLGVLLLAGCSRSGTDGEPSLRNERGSEAGANQADPSAPAQQGQSSQAATNAATPSGQPSSPNATR